MGETEAGAQADRDCRERRSGLVRADQWGLDAAVLGGSVVTCDETNSVESVRFDVQRLEVSVITETDRDHSGGGPCGHSHGGRVVGVKDREPVYR